MSKTYCPHNVSAGYVCLNCPSGWATPSKRTVQGPSDATDCSRIFRVRASFDTVILADSEEDARNKVKHGMGEIDESPVEIYASEIKQLGHLPSGWNGKCLPWGNQPLGMDRNIEDILSENASSTDNQ